MSITIEKAVKTDAAALLEFLKQVGAETENLTFGAEGLPLTVEVEASYITNVLNSKDNIQLVAKDNGKIIGDASLERMPRRMGHRGELGISVLKEYWNKGVGSRLMEAVIDFAKENDYDLIDLEVRSDNVQAIHLYEKYGFKKWGTHPSFFKIENKDIPFDSMYMRIK